MITKIRDFFKKKKVVNTTQFRSEIELVEFVMRSAGLSIEWEDSSNKEWSFTAYRYDKKREFCLTIYESIDIKYVVYLEKLLRENFDAYIIRLELEGKDNTNMELLEQIPLEEIYYFNPVLYGKHVGEIVIKLPNTLKMINDWSMEVLMRINLETKKIKGRFSFLPSDDDSSIKKEPKLRSKEEVLRMIEEGELNI